MKKLMSLLVVLSLVSAVQATPYEFNGGLVEVDAWAGVGANETILVIDWNRLDHGTNTISESHAFGYRWDGQKTQLEMLQDFDVAGTFDATFGADNMLKNIIYNDGEEAHAHIELGSWLSASTTDPYAFWGQWGYWGSDSEWDWNQGGMDVEYLVNGQFEGINAVMFFDDAPADADTSLQLDIPLVPEPATLALLACGAMLLGKRRLQSA